MSLYIDTKIINKIITQIWKENTNRENTKYEKKKNYYANTSQIKKIYFIFLIINNWIRKLN